MTEALLLIIAILILVIYWQTLMEKCYQKALAATLDIAEVEYAFQIRRYRENVNCYVLCGADGMEVRISKEDFEYHEVEVGKLWVYDGIQYHCLHHGYKSIS